MMKERGALVSTEARHACPVDIPKMAAEPKLDLAKVGPRGRTCTCNLPGLSRTPLHWATRGWCPRSDLHRHCARFKRAVSALDYVGCWRRAYWCRVRDFHPQPLRSERSVYCSGTNATKWHSRQDSHLQPRRSKRRTLIV